MLLTDRQQDYAPILLPDLPVLLESQAAARDEQRPLRILQRVWGRFVFRVGRVVDFVLGIFLPPS